MTSRIGDAGIRKVVDSVRSEQAAAPGAQLSLDEALAVLARAGDSKATSAARLLTALRAATSQADRAALVKPGLTAGEKKDLETILDDASLTLSPEARALLGEVVGRAPPKPQLTVGSLGKEAVGRTSANATVYLTDASRNLSLDAYDATVKADAQGRFSLALPWAATGDRIVAWAVDGQGNKSELAGFKLDTAHLDTTAPKLLWDRLALTPAANGQVAVGRAQEAISLRTRLSEPFATLSFRNARTGEVTRLQLDVTGDLPPHATIPGAAGDRLEVSAGDGSQSEVFGTLVVGGGALETVADRHRTALKAAWSAASTRASRLDTAAYAFGLTPPSPSEANIARNQIEAFMRPSTTNFATQVEREALGRKLLALLDVAQRFSSPGYVVTTADWAALR